MVRSWRLNAAFALRRPVVERRDWYAGQVVNLLRSQHVELVALVTHDDRSLLRSTVVPLGLSAGDDCKSGWGSTIGRPLVMHSQMHAS